MRSRSSGFTLIELLVVVAVLGIIASIGIASYSGYVSSTKMKSTENVMRQIALGQTEYYSQNGVYFTNGNSCSPDSKSSEEIETKVLGGSKSIVDKNKTPAEAISGYWICVQNHSSNYEIVARDADDPKGCEVKLTANNEIKRSSKC